MDVPRALFVSLLLILWLALSGCAAAAAGRPLLVCFGDSITAGLRPPDRPVLSRRPATRSGQPRLSLQGQQPGTSGATTKDAVADLRSILLLHPEIVIVEFGGNDGLRGLPLSETRRNLDAVLTALENAHIKILLAGITLPPNYGPEYIQQFEQIFRDLAAKHHTAFVPMIYKDLVNVPGTIQPDGIHPTAKGSEIIAQDAAAGAYAAAAQGPG